MIRGTSVDGINKSTWTTDAFRHALCLRQGNINSNINISSSYFRFLHIENNENGP